MTFDEDIGEVIQKLEEMVRALFKLAKEHGTEKVCDEMRVIIFNLIETEKRLRAMKDEIDD